MTDRTDDRRQNPHNRRDNAPFIWPHDSCEDDCPVAIRNHERITTLFHHVDEMRGDIKLSVKWKHFVWIIGGLMAIVGTVNAMVYDSYQRDRTDILQLLSSNQKIIQQNVNRIDILITRFDANTVHRDAMAMRYREDQVRLQRTLTELHEDVKVLNRYIGHKHMTNEVNSERVGEE